MTDSFVTQCPHCQTSFRVSHNQLSVARGVVRCGNCLQVFNAAKQLLEQNASLQSVLTPPVEAPVEAAPPPAPAPREVEEPPREPAPVEKGPALPAWGEVDLDQLDLDSELARLEQREIQPSLSFHAASRREDSLSAKRDEADADERLEDGLFSTEERDPVAPVLDEPPLQLDRAEEQEPLPETRTEPSLSLDLPEPDDTPPVRSLAIDDEEPDEPVERGARLSARDDDDEPEDLEPEPGDRREPGLGALPPAGSTARKESLVDLVDDPIQLDWQKPKSTLGRKLLWSLLILLAAAGLAGQYIWYHFDELARQDQYRPWFQELCPTLGCEVPSKVDIARIKSSNLVVRSHPDFKGALVVDAIIYNRAPFSQPFPLLELRFADLNGQLIASRRFKPAEYLSGELAGKAEMPSQTPIHIALDILDPGPKAVNYSLSFRSPE